MTLYLFNTHNYYNRKIVRKETINDYVDIFGDPLTITGVNFIVNDGIRTSQVVNYDPLSTDDNFMTGTTFPGYLIVVDDETNEILHRWWITESKLVRYGQAQFSLMRDVIADYKNTVLSSPSYITKGWLNTVNDTAIFNNEDMSFNQIKTSEMLIKDRSKSAWYVGYISKDAGGQTITIPKYAENAYTTLTSLDNYAYKFYIDQGNAGADLRIANVNSFVTSLFFYHWMGGIQYNFQLGWDANGNFINPVGKKLPDNAPNKNKEFIYDERYYALTGLLTLTSPGDYVEGIKLKENKEQTINDFYNWMGHYAKINASWFDRGRSLTNILSETEKNNVLAEEGKIYRVGDSFYKMRVHKRNAFKTFTVQNTNPYAQFIIGLSKNVPGVTVSAEGTDLKGQAVQIQVSGEALYIAPQLLNSASVTYTLPSNRAHTDDLPYDIVAIPAHTLGRDYHLAKTDPDFSLRTVNAFIKALSGTGSTLLFDFQLLPYAPFPESAFLDYDYDPNLPGCIVDSYFTNTNDSIIMDVITSKVAEESSIDRTFVFYVKDPHITKTRYTGTISVPTDTVGFKTANECDMYRLCSPNYNGQFEFSATKNGGVKGWNISCTYKPYTPYIKVSPIFGNLYGSDFGDARGLICGGDFSIGQTSEAWIGYELQNKNYQSIFDRQITNMEVNNSVQRTKERWNVVGGAFTGMTGGALSTGMMSGGNIYAAIAGGVAGGATSIVGGIQDIKLNEKLRQEALDYAKDNYGYQLQNIQAMPYSLTKVGSQTADYKFFPFVEYYTCTDIEKGALVNKINYNGFSIGRIGTVASFLKVDEDDIGTFVQAKPVRLDNLYIDGHIAEVIASELQTGVYIK